MLLLPLILCAFQGAAVSALGYRLTVAVFTDSDMPATLVSKGQQLYISWNWVMGDWPSTDSDWDAFDFSNLTLNDTSSTPTFTSVTIQTETPLLDVSSATKTTSLDTSSTDTTSFEQTSSADAIPHLSSFVAFTDPNLAPFAPLDAAFAVPNIRAEGDTTPAPVLTSQIIKQLLTVNLIDATTGTSMILFATSDADVVGTPGDDLTPSSTATSTSTESSSPIRRIAWKAGTGSVRVLVGATPIPAPVMIRRRDEEVAAVTLNEGDDVAVGRYLVRVETGTDPGRRFPLAVECAVSGVFEIAAPQSVS